MPTRSASGERDRHSLFDGDALTAILERSLCRSRGVQMLVVQGVVRRPVMLCARCGSRDRMLSVVQIKAGCANRDRVLSVIQ